MLEGTLAHLWRDVLEADEVDTTSTFFHLGGDSLTAIRMLSAVEEVLLAHVPFDVFLLEPTIEGLAAAIGRVRDGGAAPEPAVAREAAADASLRVPCTPAQARLWFLQQSGAAGAYNLPLAARIRGGVDADALQRALQAVVGRHEALRTVFDTEDGSPVQVVLPEVEVPLERTDLSAAAEPAAEARRRTEALVSTPFDLEQGPLLRAALWQLAEDDHVLALSLHHIICDGWSHAVVFAEVGAAYRALVAGAEPALGPPPVQYPDVARRPVPDPEPALRWWHEQLAGAPQALELGTTHRRPPVLGPAGATLRSRLPEPTADAVREFARAAGTTTFATLLSAYVALLARYSGQDTVVVGSTTAGRDRAELEHAVGFFANTVALRADLGDDPAFGTLVARMTATVRDALAHQEAPFERIVAGLGVERDAARHPVFQVFFAQTPAAPLPIEGAEPFPVSLPGARFEIVLSVEEDAAGPTLVWEYSTDLFDEATIARLDRHYARLLSAALAAPGEPIGRLPLMDAAERSAIVAGAAAAGPDQPVGCLHEICAAQAARTPDAPAVIHEGVMLTYRILDERANRLAHRLQALGVGRGTLVALCLERSLEMVVAALAVLKAGGAYVPLDPAYPTDRLSFVLEDTAAPVVVTQSALRDRVAGRAQTTVLCLDTDAAIAEQPATAPAPVAEPSDLAYVIYTSGSTGTPKGVLVEHRHVARLFSATDAWFGFGPQDTWALLHSYAFDFSVWEMWGALLYGGKLVIPSHWTIRSPEALARLMVFERVTIMNATPSLFTGALDDLLAVADHLVLRAVVFGGEALRPAALARWFHRFGDGGPRLINMYGITETTVHVTYRPIGPDAVAAGGSPIGMPIPDLEVHLLDREGEPVPTGVVGEIHVGGAGVARGYLNRPELTAERFVENPFGTGRLYRSGDLARRLEGGELDFLGRRDAQVKIRGYRIELGEIEGALLAADDVAEAAVVAVEVGPGDTRLAAYVVPAVRDADVTAALRAHLEATLPVHMVPASIVAVGALQLTTNGKLDRKALPAPAWEAAGRAAGGVFVAAATPTEQAIAEIWREVLGLERVSTDDDFFALGGHSLLAARIATKVRARFDIELSVRALFDQPTLARFAQLVDGERPPAPAAAPTEAPAGAGNGRLEPLAFGQQQLLFFDTMRPEVPVYNAALAIEVDGPLHLDALRAALDDVVERHETLRTVFGWEGDEAGQRVLGDWSFELPVVDLRMYRGAARTAELERRMRREARRRFDLERDLALRATVFRLASEQHLVLVATHHIAMDGWSVDVFFAELSALYAARRDGRPATLPALGRSYRDYARWQRERLGGERRAELMDHWRTALAGAAGQPPLRPDKPRPDEQSFEGQTIVTRLAAPLSAGVVEVARRHQVTPYMLLLAAFGVFLRTNGGGDDILVGTPAANRGAPEFESLVGYFNNTLVVRLRMDGAPTFGELLRRVRTAALDSFEHEELPFESVVEAVGVRRDPTANPLFQVNFRARVGPPAQLELAGATTRWKLLDMGISRFDMALECHVLDDGITCHFEYSSALFHDARAKALADGFGTLLERLLATPGAPIPGAPAPAPPPDRAGIRSFRARQTGGEG